MDYMEQENLQDQSVPQVDEVPQEEALLVVEEVKHIEEATA